MLQVARLAPNLLLDAAERVTGFFSEQFNPDGGARDRSGESDLYYTVFAIEGLVAMQADLPTDAIQTYLRSFEDGEQLDFVHLTCLARCWAAMPNGKLEPAIARRILRRIETYRSADGGYSATTVSANGSAYHSFLAFGAYQDLRGEPPQPERIGECLNELRCDDGGYANDRTMKIGTTPATAAAATLSRQLNIAVPNSVGDWLLQRSHAQGGFLAMPNAPMPDLLSTATTLHALSGMKVAFDQQRDACLDFVDSLWTGRAFCGNWGDDQADCEYTYYALLALGHLSL